MKKFILFCALLTLGLASIAQSWNWINPTTGLQQINDISFISPDQGVAVGDNGAILNYLNGEWSLAESPVNTTLNAVEFIHPNLAWAVGNEGVILRYSGKNWIKVSSPIIGYLKDISYVDENHCWAVGSAILFYDGTSWQVQAELSGNEAVGFISANEGWAGSTSTSFYHFSNGSWSADPTFVNGNLLFFHTIEAAGEGRLLMNGKNVEGEGLLYENNGQGWQPIASGGVNGGISFYDAAHGFGIEHARPLNNDLLPTIKHFNNDVWSTDYVFEKRDHLFSSIEALSDNEAMAGDALGYIHHGKDGNWGLANGFMCDSILDIDFVEPNKGFIAAHNSGIWKYDAGEWSNIFYLKGYTFNTIKFLNENSGYIAAYTTLDEFPPPYNIDSKLFRFYEGIFTEIDVPWTGITAPISSIHEFMGELIISSNNHIYICYEDEWEIETLPATESISKMFIQNLHWTIKNQSSKRWWEHTYFTAKRNDSGISSVIYYKNQLYNQLIQIYETSSGLFNDLCVTWRGDVYAVGTHGLIAYFDGINWTEIEPLTDEDLLSVHVNDNGNGWAVGKNGTMLQCENGQWSLHNSPTTYDLNVVSFYDRTLGFIGGSNGALLCTSGKLPVGIFNKPISQSFDQLHIYPNPTQESFFIEINQPASKIQVSLSDITLRTIHEQSFGLQETIRIHPGIIPSGLYFVKVMNGNQVLTGKLVID